MGKSYDSRPLERLEVVAKDHFGSLAQLALAMGYSSKGIFGAYKSQKRNLGNDIYSKLEAIGINTEYIQTGDGEPIISGGLTIKNMVNELSLSARGLLSIIKEGEAVPTDHAAFNALRELLTKGKVKIEAVE